MGKKSDSEAVARRHPDIPQDPLPGMPERPEGEPKKARAASSKPVWRRLKGAKTKRPPRCPYCVNEVTLDGETIVRPAVWQRTCDGEKDLMCAPHAEPQKAADDAARKKERREKLRKDMP